jgi:methylmalonyl-CoA mutase
VSSTDDGLRIDPLSQRRAGAGFTARGDIERAWDVVQRIDDPDPIRANRQARDDLEGGATGIALVFEARAKCLWLWPARHAGSCDDGS